MSRRLLALCLSLFALSGCATSNLTTSSIGRSTAELASALQEASKKLHIDIVPQSIASASQGGVTLMLASIAGVEHIPATAYANGVDIGFVYFDDKSCRGCSGFYRLRAYLSATTTGPTDARVDWIDARGMVRARSTTTAIVESLTVPPEQRFEGSMFRTNLNFPKDMSTGFRPIAEPDFWCSNGLHIPVIQPNFSVQQEQ